MSKTKGDESWVDEITDSESEDMPSSSTKLKRTSTEEDLYLKIIQEDGVVMEHVSCDVKKANVTSGSSSVQPQEVITLDDKDSCEDEMVNQYLDDIERKLEENIKKKSQTKNTTDDWKVVDYFRDIIYVEDDDPGSKSTKIKQRDKRIECKRRRQVYASPSQDGVKRRRRKANVSLSDGEIISDDDLILSDISLSPEPSSSSVRHRRDKHVEDNRRGSDYSRSGVRARQETEKNRLRNNRCDKYRSRSNRDYDSSIESSDQSPVCEVREKKRIVLLPEPIHSRYPEHRSHRHNSGTLEQSDYKEDRHSRKYQHEISPEQVPKKKSSKKHESKKHKSETKRGVKSKSSSDYFDEDKYHGSDKSRIRTLKKKYDEYLKYAKKFKNEDNDSDHIEKFVKMRSKLREDDGKKLLESTEASIDYKKEEEKFLRSLETYLEIKKKQEKSMSGSTQSLLMSSSSSKEYDPENISSEEEEYVPEKFTPENMALGRVEEYDPCSVSKVNNLTYEPTKIDEYEPTTLPLDEEYCPMPVKTNLPITYNPTKVYGGTNVCQSMPGGVRHPGWTNPTAQHPTIPKQLNPNIRLNKANLNPTEYKPAHKVISKNTVFIGNTVNPIALNQNANLIPMKPINVPPPTTSIDKTRIMSKLVNEKLLEIEKKKRQLLEEINRKKLLKIKEKCDEVALKKLEQKKLDLMEEINKKTNSVLKTIVNKVDGTSQANSDGIRKTVVDTTKTNVVCNQVTPVEPSNIKIKQEKLDTNTAPINNINEKLTALKKKQADLMSQIQSKLSKNTEMVIKEKADVTSKLEALERNKSALIQQLNKKQAEISNEAIVIKKEKVNPIESNVTGSATTSVVSNSENSSSSEKTVQIKQEKITLSEKPVVKMTEKSTIVQGTIRVKTVPAINEKLTDLEQKKAKLMAEIAAKSNKVGGVMTASVEKETLNEKLSRLAKEKEQLLANIEKKKNQTIAAPAISNKPIASVDMKRKLAPSVDMKSIPSQSARINEDVIVPTAASRLTEDILPPDFFEELRPDLIAPVVAWLCHEECPENGTIIDSAVGWAAKCHIVRGEGTLLRKSITDPVMLENVRDLWSKVTDMTGASKVNRLEGTVGNLLEKLNELKHGAATQSDRQELDYIEGHFSYTNRDAILYALGVGATTQQSSELRYLYEGHEDFSVLPSYGIIPGMMAVMSSDLTLKAIPGKEFDLSQVLHGEQYLTLHQPLPTYGDIVSRCKVIDVLDKGKHAVIIVQSDSYVGDSHISTGQSSVFIVGGGGFGGKRSSSVAIPCLDPPSRSPDSSLSDRTSPDQAALYRLSGDVNPLHIDPDFARISGYKTPILHGLCSLGFSVRHVLRQYAGNDPALFKSLKVRFAKPVLPGQTLRTDMWQESNRIHFQTSVAETNQVVISGAYVDLKSSVQMRKTGATSRPPGATLHTHRVNAADDLISQAVFDGMLERVQADPSLTKKVNGVFVYVILKNGKKADTWTADLKKGKVYKGEPEAGVKADTTITVEDSDLVDIALGKLNAQSAFMKGKLKIKGNIMLTQKLKLLMAQESKL